MKKRTRDQILASCLLEVIEQLIDDSWTHEQKVFAYDNLKPELEQMARGAQLPLPVGNDDGTTE